MRWKYIILGIVAVVAGAACIAMPLLGVVAAGSAGAYALLIGGGLLAGAGSVGIGVEVIRTSGDDSQRERTQNSNYSSNHMQQNRERISIVENLTNQIKQKNELLSRLVVEQVKELNTQKENCK